MKTKRPQEILTELAKQYCEKAGIDFSKSQLNDELLQAYEAKNGKLKGELITEFYNFCEEELKNRIKSFE